MRERTAGAIDTMAARGQPAGRPVKRSPAHRMHAALGARFIEEAGWEIPAGYEGIEELAAIHDSVAVADVTARGKIDVRGVPRAPATHDEIVAPISDDWTLVFTHPMNLGPKLMEFEARVGGAGMVTDVTHLYAGFALAGPRLPDFLARVTSWDPRTLEPGAAAGAPIADVSAVVVRRDLPFPVVEVYGASEFGRYLWETLLEKAGRLGGGPVGWDFLRAEGWS